jgi:ribosomal protein L25 (general stress protein Ctc)
MLAGCEGFAVQTRAGRVGVVDAVLYGESTEPSALSVRRGRFARGVRIIEAADVEGIDARARRIDVRSDGIEITF